MTVAANVNQCLSTIKGIEAQLSTLALNSNIEESSKVFHETMLVINEIKMDLEKRKNELEVEEPQYKG
jgi:isochorismate synthase EntC